ncbi:MAG: IS110 family transposase [Methylorubrum populi]
MAEHTKPVAGIDTGKVTLDVARTDSTELWKIANTASGWDDLCGRLEAASITRVGIEASGGYERGVVAALRTRGFEVDLHQPLQIRAFAKLSLRRAKNDRLDARLIAAFTLFQSQQREARPAPDPRLQPFAARLVFIEQAMEDAARAKLRLEHQTDPRLRRQLEGDARRARLRAEREFARLAEEVRAQPDLAARLDLLLTIPGLGEKTALRLLVLMPELGRISREQAASLAGLAPFDHDSGQHEGERHIGGGRARVRTALYTAALPASYRWNPALITLRTRLIARGKTHKKALIACARKLLTYANAVLARGTPWKHDTAHA